MLGYDPPMKNDNDIDKLDSGLAISNDESEIGFEVAGYESEIGFEVGYENTNIDNIIMLDSHNNDIYAMGQCEFQAEEISELRKELDKKISELHDMEVSFESYKNLSKMQIEILRKELTEKTQENVKMNQKLTHATEKCQILEHELNTLKNQRIVEFKQMEKNVSVDEIKNLLSSVLSSNQIDLILNRKKQVRWTQDELSMAFTIRYISKNCYLFLKNKMKLPLPALTTLERWVSKISISPGNLTIISAISTYNILNEINYGLNSLFNNFFN